MKKIKATSYNARVSAIRRVHDELMVLRVLPEAPLELSYEPGQYTVLGLGTWEPRDDGVPATDRSPRLIRRAYSYSCPMRDDAGELVTTSQTAFAEFYIAHVSRPSDDPPMLTPRLFALAVGDRIHIGPHAHGNYTLAHVGPGDDVLFFATGTGEAPHNAMTAELLSRGHSGGILCATCVRHQRDLAYIEAHRELERRFPNYRYVALTTREPKNVDAARDDFVGKQYLQDYILSGALEKAFDRPIVPDRTHAYLCGNPAMIGLPQHGRGDAFSFPEPVGMAEILTKLGFRLDAPHAPGNIHFEKYW